MALHARFNNDYAHAISQPAHSVGPSSARCRAYGGLLLDVYRVVPKFNEVVVYLIIFVGV